MATLITLLVSQLNIGRTFTDFLSIDQIDLVAIDIQVVP